MGRMTAEAKESLFLTKLRHLFGQMPEPCGSFESFMENFDVDDSQTRKSMEKIFLKQRHTVSRGWVVGRGGRTDGDVGVELLGSRRDRDRAGIPRTLRRSRLVRNDMAASRSDDASRGIAMGATGRPDVAREYTEPAGGNGGEGVEGVEQQATGMWHMDFLFDGARAADDRDSAAYLRSMVDRLTMFRPENQSRRGTSSGQRQRQRQPHAEPELEPQPEVPGDQPAGHSHAQSNPQSHPAPPQRASVSRQPPGGGSMLESLRSVPVDQLLSNMP